MGGRYEAVSEMYQERNTSKPRNRGFRLGIDIGGTFTDVMAMDDTGASAVALKTPSIPASPEQAVLNGIRELASGGVPPEAIDLFVHGTTLAVNTLIERSGAPTGLLVTQGFRDVLEIRRLRLENTTDFYDDKPEPLVPRHLVAEVSERLYADGRARRPLDAAEVESRVQALVDQGVAAIAICFLHAYRNPAHERQARDLIRARWPELFVCTSTDVWPQQREYERCLVTVMNAFIGQRMAGYLHRLMNGAREVGLRASVLTTKSNGGIMTAERAAESPVQTLLSGPVSGVIGAAFLARAAGYGRVITLDMGGTSADVAVVDGEPSYSTENQVGDFPVIMPAVDVSSIGAGGGSIAWVDSAGVLKVGPRSAGADPGPACYDRGSEEAAVTDAYVHLGIIDPARFLGGRIVLNRARAEAALKKVGSRLGLGTRETAQAILDVASSNMYAQFTPLMARRGADPRDFALLAYGGAGPTHAFLLAREIGIRRIIIPPSPGTTCALGCLVADLRNDFVATVYRSTRELTDAHVRAEFDRLAAGGHRWLEEEVARGVDLLSVRVLYGADVRYEGQSFEVPVAVPEAERGSLAAIERRFHRQYHAVYGLSDPGAPVEIINLRTTVVGETRKPSLAPARPVHELAAGPGNRDIFLDGQALRAQVVQRAALRPGDGLSGPAIIEQFDTTACVPPGFRVTVDAQGNLLGEMD